MAVKKSGLGKGLDSLIPVQKSKKKETETSVTEKGASPKLSDKNISVTPNNTDGSKNVVTLKLTMIEPNREQPRHKFDEDSLLELSESIRQFGILQPLLVQKKEDHYEIIAGERRWRAAKLAGLKEIPVLIQDFTEQEVVEISLIENIQREDLNPIEEAQAYQRLLNEFHLKQDEIAERVSKSRTTVTNSMRLLKLDERVQQMVIDDMLTTGHARALLALENGDLQFRLAQKIFDEKLSVREVEKLVRSLVNAKPGKPVPPVNEQEEAVYQSLQEKIQASLGTQVTIRRKNGQKGRIEIEYFSYEELERLMYLFQQASKNENV